MENQDINPWKQIWTEPRKIMRSILSTSPHKTIVWLAIIAGVLGALTYALSLKVSPPNRVENFRVLTLLGILLAGGISGLIHLYFGGWLYRLTGSWIGGKGSFTDVKCAVGWSNYPYIIASIFGLLGLLSIPHLWLQVIFGLINFVILIWGLIIFLNLLSEAHQFSIWRGIVTVLIAAALIFVVILVIALLISLMTSHSNNLGIIYFLI